MFVASLLASAGGHGVPLPLAPLLAGIIMLAAVAALVRWLPWPARKAAGAPAASMPAASGPGRATGRRIPGWSGRRLQRRSFGARLPVAALDGATGPQQTLSGAPHVTPC